MQYEFILCFNNGTRVYCWEKLLKSCTLFEHVCLEHIAPLEFCEKILFYDRVQLTIEFVVEMASICIQFLIENAGRWEYTSSMLVSLFLNPFKFL